MSLKTFTDNIIILAIENCLICELPSILEPNMVNTLTDDEIKELVSERPEVTEEREHLRKGLAALTKGLSACRRHRPLEVRGKSIFAPESRPRSELTVVLSRELLPPNTATRTIQNVRHLPESTVHTSTASQECALA